MEMAKRDVRLRTGVFLGSLCPLWSSLVEPSKSLPAPPHAPASVTISKYVRFIVVFALGRPYILQHKFAAMPSHKLSLSDVSGHPTSQRPQPWPSPSTFNRYRPRCSCTTSQRHRECFRSK